MDWSGRPGVIFRLCHRSPEICVCVLVGWLVGFLTSSSTTRLYRGRAPRQERLTILRAATHETELGDHDFCLSRSHYTDTDPTCRERAATAGIEPGTSSPGVARSTAELPRPPCVCVCVCVWGGGVSEGQVVLLLCGNIGLKQGNSPNSNDCAVSYGA